ncbi:3'(2'),5'-bisphosphate nucleotidase CysQ [Leptolyngbya sp. O-77]|uniref:3'(2'),5'-bisphosphate nucleotidase CysQ family protein n=1 Tax=Leptolyngbya sp. O-77 TaxID=1080068 RepID=UPI00074D2FA2|nr:inositol monophosphatase family protein [Leptolyngbya sp. O-77]BAU42862.1 3'(2'),5'-bisphosphate nucleotidase CysQ [Leptolyngbya sp. O-77]
MAGDRSIWRQGRSRSTKKGLDDYVTDVDRALDAQLAGGLTALFPADSVISEENAASRQQFSQHAGRLWLVDPLDGTEDFIHGKPHYSVMVGALEQGRPTAGWVYAPVFDQLYFGGEELGLFGRAGAAEAAPLVPTKPNLPRPDLTGDRFSVLIGTKDARRYGESILRHIPQAQFGFIGSFGLKVLEVIQGRAALYIYLNRRVKLWDTVGPLALARAAGLVCCDLDGKPIRFDAAALDPDTLTHQQPILVGWPPFLNLLLPLLQRAIADVD